MKLVTTLEFFMVVFLSMIIGGIFTNSYRDNEAQKSCITRADFNLLADEFGQGCGADLDRAEEIKGRANVH